MRYVVAVTRFNNNTYKQLTDYKKKKAITGCIYGTPSEIKEEIGENYYILVLEMNNDINKIMGIGKIINRKERLREKIYKNHDYNRIIYKGTKWIGYQSFNQLDKQLIERFEECLFKGSCHIKRGSGITLVPKKMYEHSKLKDEGIHVAKWLDNMVSRK